MTSIRDTNPVKGSFTVRNGEILPSRVINAAAVLENKGIDALRASDARALSTYLEEVRRTSRSFRSTRERVSYLRANALIRPEIFEWYSDDDVEALYSAAEQDGYHFTSYIGALRFYTSYAMRGEDGLTVEDFPHRACAVALELARGDIHRAEVYMRLLLDGSFIPTTPTLANVGTNTIAESISCYLLRVEDTVESVTRAINDSIQISRRNGGVALLLTNLREAGAAAAGKPGVAAGIVPVMKLLEDAFTYANQAGQRQGAGAAYLHAHHPEILTFLDSKRENADEKVRIKSLSLGVVVPDITFSLARENREMHLFSPADVLQETGVPLSDIDFTDRYMELVNNQRIRRTTIPARDLFRAIAETQFESGYPYLLFDDNATARNTSPGRVTHSNLCTEVLQSSSPSELARDISFLDVGADITCNLGSLNIARIMNSAQHVEATVETAVRFLTAAAEDADLDFAPSIRRGRDESVSIGLGQMNLQGYLASIGVRYGSDEALDFVSSYFAAMAYYTVRASNLIAKERGRPFAGFEKSTYATGEWFEKYLSHSWLPRTAKCREEFDRSGFRLPSITQWESLRDDVVEHGIYNKYLQAIAPTASVAHLNGSTNALLPVSARIEARTEGRLGRVYAIPPGITSENEHLYEDAFDVGPLKIIDTYAAAGAHVDQGLSLTLFMEADASTRDLNRAHIYAWRNGLKSIYYVRVRQRNLDGVR